MSRAIVTGASGGLGLEFAKLLAADKYDLVLIARSADKLEAIAADLRERHSVNVETLALDLSQLGAAAAVFARVPECDVLINNAGFATNGRFDEIPEERIREEVLLDVLTLTELTRAYLPGDARARSGASAERRFDRGFSPRSVHGRLLRVQGVRAFVLASDRRGTSRHRRHRDLPLPRSHGDRFRRPRACEYTRLFKRLPVANAASVARAGYLGMLQGRDLVIPGLFNNLVALGPRLSSAPPLDLDLPQDDRIKRTSRRSRLWAAPVVQPKDAAAVSNRGANCRCKCQATQSADLADYALRFRPFPAWRRARRSRETSWRQRCSMVMPWRASAAS